MAKWKRLGRGLLVNDAVVAGATVAVDPASGRVRLSTIGVDVNGEHIATTLDLRAADATALGALLIESAPILRMERGELP